MTNINISLDTLVSRNEAMLASQLDGETIMMDVDNGLYLGMNTTGSRIWSLLEKPLLAKDLCDQLAMQFKVSETECESQVLSFLNDLLQRKVIVIVSDTTAGEA